MQHFVDPFCHLCSCCCLIYSLQPCNHLLTKNGIFGFLVSCVCLCLVTYPCGVPGQEWFLIVSIPDICLPFYMCTTLVLGYKQTNRMYVSRNMRFPTMWYCDQQSLRSACPYAQSDQSLCKSLEYNMTVKLLTE